MRLALTFIVLITLTYVSGKAQTITDSEFKWIKYEDCIPKETCKEIFLKVEEEPALTKLSKPKFDQLIGAIINEINLEENKSGVIKIKILFAKGQNLCITQIGTKSFELSDKQIDKIKKRIGEIDEFKHGRQRNIDVDCLGILYIDITNSKVTKTRNVNFTVG